MASYLKSKEIAPKDGIYYYKNNSIFLKAGQAMPDFENGSSENIVKVETGGIFNTWKFVD